MKLLWLVRPDLETHVGGDTIQILSTAEKLRELGCRVELTSERRPDRDEYFDAAHLFHLDRLWENLPHLRHLRSFGVPVALSPIWWPTDEFDARGRTGVQGGLARAFGARAYPTLKVLQRSLPVWLRAGLAPRARPPLSFGRGARELLKGVDVLLPNSTAEAEAIERRFRCAGEVVVVPNAADAGFFTPEVGRERRGVVCVGRIEPRKNQLALIEALKGLDEPLTLIGRAGRFARDYEARCREVAGPGVEFTGPQDREGVRDRLRSARVHCCPSWYETPGLASLEAALSGCALVVTPGGSTREYFGEGAWFGDPGDPASLRAAVESALAGPPQEGLRERLLEECSWERAARATLRGYHAAFGVGSSRPTRT